MTKNYLGCQTLICFNNYLFLYIEFVIDKLPCSLEKIDIKTHVEVPDGKVYIYVNVSNNNRRVWGADAETLCIGTAQK